MICPCCKKPMVVLELHEVEIDHCLACRGVWLDGGELELLMQDSPERDSFVSSLTVFESPEKKRRCPICRKKMEKVTTGPGFSGEAIRPVTLDRCTGKDGLWCDAGELEAMLEISGRNSPSKVLDLLKEIFSRNVS